MSITNSFDEFFNSNGTGKKIGELKNKECKIAGLTEYKSTKSGKSSIKVSIDCEGTEIRTFLGYSTEGAMKISLSKLTHIATASVGKEEAKKMFEESCKDEDVSDNVDLILDYANKVNKKLRKNPVSVYVDREKDDQGFWNTKYRIKGDEPSVHSASKSDTETEDKKEEGDFYDALR